MTPPIKQTGMVKFRDVQPHEDTMILQVNFYADRTAFVELFVDESDSSSMLSTNLSREDLVRLRDAISEQLK
jgi:hypothetical protein